MTRVTAPSLVIYGQQDRLVDALAAGRAAHLFSEARVVVLPRTGYVAHMEHPGAVAAEIGILLGIPGGCPPVLRRNGRGKSKPGPFGNQTRLLESTVSLPPLVEPAAELTVDEVRRCSR